MWSQKRVRGRTISGHAQTLSRFFDFQTWQLCIHEPSATPSQSHGLKPKVSSVILIIIVRAQLGGSRLAPTTTQVQG